MNEQMKILIGYDGSECSEKMIWDLKRAGLPSKAEALVMSVAEHWLPAPTSFGGVDVHFTEDPDEGGNTIAMATRAQEAIKQNFPEWNVRTDAIWGTPASKLIEKADEWKPDLIIVGSHGRSALGRFFLGSVSQKIVHEAHTSVRIARGHSSSTEMPVKILIATDGSKGAEAAIAEVAARDWPADSQVRIVNATWTVPPITSSRMVAPIAEWISNENARVKAAIDSATTTLQGAGLNTSVVVEEEDPKKLICEEAERWGADCIFLGAKGMGVVERFMIGSVSSAVAARAHCSVEIVRV